MSMAYLGQGIDIILGQDFLTWLWYVSETPPHNNFQTKDGRAFSVRMEQRICVQGGEGENRDTATVSGTLSELKEARLGLSFGKKVTRALILFEREAETWRFSLRAEDFAVSGMKMPAAERNAAPGDDPDAIFFERMYALETCMEMFNIVYGTFLTRRVAPLWEEEVSRVRAWILHESAHV